MWLRRASLVAAVSIAVVSSVSHAQQAPAEPADAQGGQEISVRKGQLAARIASASLIAVLEELSARTRVPIVRGPGLDNDTLSTQVPERPIDDALRQILKGYDTFFYYAADDRGGNPTLRTVWVYRTGGGTALQPVPPDTWASTRDLEAALEERDPAIREMAYEALMARPDRAALNRVVLAIQGSGETDPDLRQRLLSTALTKGLELPKDMLGDLVRADPSEAMRLMALDAMTGDPGARDVAVAALDDASELVRERAKEFLTDLDNIARRRDQQ